MLKKLFFISFMCVAMLSSVHAYTVGQSFTVVNKTDASVDVSINVPNSKESIQRKIVAGGETTINMDTSSGSAPFYITRTDNKELITQGRVVFYIDIWANRYSFLDAVSGSKGLDIDQKFYCQEEEAAGRLSQKVPAFDNQIVISGTPKGGIEKVTTFPAKIACKGLKSSELLPTYGFETGYAATCHDGRKAEFFRDKSKCKGALCHPNGYTYMENGTQKRIDALINNLDKHNSMDAEIGNVFCNSRTHRD